MKPSQIRFVALPKKNLAYLLIKKCGCTSIIAAFQKHLQNSAEGLKTEDIHGRPDSVLSLEQFHQLKKKAFTFTLVRDPITRFVSFYTDKVIATRLAANLTLQNRDHYGYHINMSFDEAVHVVVNNRKFPEPHVAIQTEMIDELDFDLDFIGKFESFKDSISEVAKQTGVELDTLHLNKRRCNPVLVNREQFDRLSEYYREDQLRFGYPTDYDEWCRINVENSSKQYQTEQGFLFKNQARLKKHAITCHPDRFRLCLTWDVLPTQSARRCIRIMNQNDQGQDFLLRLPDNVSLKEIASSQNEAVEIVDIKRKRLPADIDPNRLAIEVFFLDNDQNKSELVNFKNGNHLILSLPPEIDVN